VIREYRQEDKEQLLALLSKLHRKSPYAGFSVDWKCVSSIVDQGAYARAIFVSEHLNKLTGFIICGCKALWWNSNVRIGSDLFFYSTKSGEGSGLLKKLVDYSIANGVSRIECGISSFRKPSDVWPAYELAGFHKEGSLFVMNLEKECERNH
jgi:hypothetical protein